MIDPAAQFKVEIAVRNDTSDYLDIADCQDCRIEK